MLQFNVAFARVVGQEVIPEVNELAALGGSCVLGDSDGGLVIYKEGGGVGAEHSGALEDATQPCSLLGSRYGGDIFSLARRELCDALPQRSPTEGGAVAKVQFARYEFLVSDVGGVVSIRVGCEERYVGDGLVSAVADVEGDAGGREVQPVLGGVGGTGGHV